jgi:prephenate dehydratase
VNDKSTSARPSRIGYLGPAGTFTEQALLTQPDLAAAEHVLFPSFADIFHAITTGDVDQAFVAIENSIAGSVNITLDTLIFESELIIQREVVIPIVMNLLVKPGSTLEDITEVRSIPIATEQCRGWLRERLPNAAMVASNATAEAVQAVGKSSDGSVAAIGASLAAEIYGLDILAPDIADHPGDQTRFVLVERSGVAPRTGHDKTSIVVFQRSNEPGSLLAILQEFSARQIDLSKLESRPTKRELGDYCFLIDFRGHIADEVVADALRNLKAKGHKIKFLGSFAAAGGRSTETRAEANKTWAEAKTWVADLQAGITQ